MEDLHEYWRTKYHARQDRLLGVNRKRGAGAPPKLSGERLTRMVALFECGEALSRIAGELNISEATVRRTANKLGLRKRRCLVPMDGEPKPRIALPWYETGTVIL